MEVGNQNQSEITGIPSIIPATAEFRKVLIPDGAWYAFGIWAAPTFPSAPF